MFLFWIVQESLRFCEQAVMIIRALGRVIGSFSDPEELPSTTKELEKTHGVDIQQQRVGYTQRQRYGTDSCTLCQTTMYLNKLLNIFHYISFWILTATEIPSFF